MPQGAHSQAEAEGFVFTDEGHFIQRYLVCYHNQRARQITRASCVCVREGVQRGKRDQSLRLLHSGSGPEEEVIWRAGRRPQSAVYGPQRGHIPDVLGGM